MKYLAIDSFLSDLDTLCKKPKNNCDSVRVDICRLLQPAIDSNEFILISDILLHVEDENKHVLIKTRVQNSRMGGGKSKGFRLISLVSLIENRACFLTVYPKKGKFAKENITDNDIVILLQEFIELSENDSLKIVDIYNDLEVIA